MQQNAAQVEEVQGRPRVPRWGGDGWPLSPELARRLFVLRTQAVESLREGVERLRHLLAQDYALTPEGVELLAAHFQQQEAASEVPDAATLLIEAVDVGVDTELYLHTPLNRTGNDALARVAVARLASEGLSATLAGGRPGLAAQGARHGGRSLVAAAPAACGGRLRDGTPVGPARERGGAAALRAHRADGLDGAAKPGGQAAPGGRHRLDGPRAVRSAASARPRFRPASSGPARGAGRDVRRRGGRGIRAATAAADGALPLAAGAIAVRAGVDAAGRRGRRAIRSRPRNRSCACTQN